MVVQRRGKVCSQGCLGSNCAPSSYSPFHSTIISVFLLLPLLSFLFHRTISIFLLLPLFSFLFHRTISIIPSSFSQLVSKRHLSCGLFTIDYWVTRAPLLYFKRSWVALSFKVCPSVRHPWHLTRSPLHLIYKGIGALYWPRVINYQLPPPHSVLYWTSTQFYHLVTHSWANWI